jgi:hypothetical protein
MKFLIRKRDNFCKFKEIKGLRGGEHLFAAPGIPQLYAEIAENNRFRTETN